MEDPNKAQTKQLLHYGCLIYLTYKDDTGQEYIVTADGYTKNKIQLKTKEEILKHSSITASLFKIYPTFYNNEFIKARKKYDEKRKLKKFTTLERRETRAEIPKQIKAMEEETSLNYEQYDKFKGSPVIFGQTIQLLHINSNKYLFYDLNHVSEYESNNLKVGLKDEHSDEACFRIQPCYTFQQEGSGNIYDEDIVNVVSTVDQMKKIGGEPFLHASKPKQFESKDRKIKEKREVNISTEKKTPWKVHIFSEFIDDRDGFLQVCDTVWINYSESDLNLIIQNDQVKDIEGSSTKIPLQLEEDQKYQIKFENCATNASYNKFVGNSNGMFTIESESIFKGGLVRWYSSQNKSLYRLRHLTTNQYLKVSENSNFEFEYLLTTEPEFEKASLFRFELIYSTLTSYNREKAQQYLQKDSYFRLSTVINDEELWMKKSIQELSQYDQNDEEDEGQYIPSFHKNKKEEYVFKLAKANFNEVRMTNFLLSCLKTLKGAEHYLTPNFLVAYTMNDERFQIRYKNFNLDIGNLERCLNDLHAFCHNCLIAYLQIDQEYGSINYFIQNVLREQQFIELLVRMLCISFPKYKNLVQLQEMENQDSEEIKFKNLGEEQRKTKEAMHQSIKKEFFNRKKKVCSLIYKLLAGICEKNQSNQEKAAIFLPIFAQQSRFINQALNCVISIIQDQEELLLTIHQQVNDDEIKSESRKHHHHHHHRHKHRKNNNLENLLQIDESEYIEQYNKMTDQIVQKDFYIRKKWDLLSFFTSLLKVENQTVQKKRELISFLEFTSIYQGRGVNINQETIYKCLISSENGEDLFNNNILIRIKAQGNEIKIYYYGQEMIFQQLFAKEKKSKASSRKQIESRRQAQMIPSDSNAPSQETILSLIQEQIQFFCSMCNSRNNTWKKFVENIIQGDILLYLIQDEYISFELRAIFCKLLNKVYIDQEPRRIQVYPELCKVVKKEKQKDEQSIMSQEKVYEEINLNSIKIKLLEFIKKKSEDMEQLSQSFEMKDDDAVKQDKLKKISKEFAKTYNKLTLEIIRLLKLMIDFGQYSIKDGNQKDFFGMIQSLFVIFEFDPTYPEARKILLEKRKEDQKKKNQLINPQQLMGNVFGVFAKGIAMFDVFGLMDDNSAKDKKKKTKTLQVESESMNMNESFLKQANVLKKILSKFLQEGDKEDLLIKLEICDILNQYQDQKLDYCLNIFKKKFKEYVQKLGLLEKLEYGEIKLEDKKALQEQFKKVMQNCIQALIPSILKTGTTVDERDPRLNRNMNSFGFANINFAGGLSFEGPSKEVENIDINQILDFEILPTMITIFCMTQSLSLETKSLNILTRFYNQRQEFAELASKMLLLFDDKNIQIFKVLKKRIRKLAKNVDESETWMQDLQISFNQNILYETVGHFQYFNQLLFEGSYLDQYEKIISGESEEIDQVRQSVMRNLNVYSLAVTLIKENIYMFDQIKDEQIKRLFEELFQACFLFLKNFVINNSENQIVLSEDLVAFQQNITKDLGQIGLINEIFRNNKKICLEKAVGMIDDFIQFIIHNGRKAKYLEFFLIIQCVKKEYISSNQKQVLNVLINPKFKYHIFTLKDRENNQQHHQVKHEFDFSQSNPEDEPYIYHAKLIEVLYNCTIGKEGMLQNETRLRNIVSLKYALELLQSNDNLTDINSAFQSFNSFPHPTDKISQLKIPLLNYIYYTYLESEKLSEEIFKCIQDLADYMEKERNRLQSLQDFPSPQLIQYFYTHFLMVMNAFIKLYQKELRESTQNHQNQFQVQSQIENLFLVHEKMKKTLNELEFRPKQLNDFDKMMLQYFLCEDIQMEEQKQQEKLEKEEQQQKLEKLNEQKVNSKLKKKQTTLFKKKTERKIDLDYDFVWKQLWTVFLDTFLNSKELISEIQGEQLIFSKALDKVEEIYSKDNMMTEHINKNEIFKKLINYLNKAHNESGSSKIVQQVLQSLGNYIVISQDNIDENAEDEEKDQLLYEEKNSHQNFLNSNNAMTVILVLLSDHRISDQLFDNLIQFGIQMLDGGNREVQKSVYSFFLNYTSSEVFFMKLHEKFDIEIANIKKEDDDENEDEIYAFQKSTNHIENILRFMQLLAEGHYSELQNYMRFQQMNYHTYDLFTDVVELLNNYFNVKKEKYFSCMIQAFDTITEYVQGPCFENQTALFQANFLDMASNLLTVDEIMDEIEFNIQQKNLGKQMDDFLMMDDNKQKKNIQIFPRWMYARLKYKCSITLLSLLEARQNNDNVIRLIKSLNIDMLKRNIVDIYHMFQTQYKETYSSELFLHFNCYPENKNEQQYASFIIETGFNLYVLYSIFLEVKDNQQEGNKIENVEEEEGFQKFLQESMIGQIMSLFLNILNALRDTVVQMKNQAQDIILGKGDQEIDYEYVKEQLKERRALLFKKSMNFFSSKSAHIEVLREDKKIEKTYFYMPPFCLSLDKQTKTAFNQDANRISVKAKVSCLMQQSDEIIKIMKLNYRLHQELNKIKILAVIVNQIQLLRNIAFLLALCINILVLFAYTKDEQTEQQQNFQDVIITLGTIVIVLTMLIVAYFLAKTAPLIIKKAWVGVKKDNLNIPKRLIMTFLYLLTDFYVLYYLIYGFTAVLGTIYNPFLFAFHLFDVLVRYPVLLNVVKAVWLPKKAIMFTLFLFIVLMYVFSLFAYYWLYDSYEPGFCDSTWVCLLTAIDRSFKSDGGLGGFLKSSTEAEPNDDIYFLIRFFFDNLYFILLMIIMINIVSGIIIDTFGTLRENLKNYTFDLENFCFICGFDKETIEKASRNQRGFSYHIKQEHYLWNYIFYIAYIKNKDKTELSGIESYVSDKLAEEDISWFPTFKALCMSDNSEEQEQAVVMKQLQKIKEDQQELQEILDSINDQLEKMEEEHNNNI